MQGVRGRSRGFALLFRAEFMLYTSFYGPSQPHGTASEMSSSEAHTPAKGKSQSSLYWAFKRGAEEAEPAEKPFAEVSPFKKLEKKMSTEQFQAFKRKLESERDEKVKQQKAHLSCAKNITKSRSETTLPRGSPSSTLAQAILRKPM